MTTADPARRRLWWATWGLPITWVANDLEEALTFSPSHAGVTRAMAESPLPEPLRGKLLEIYGPLIPQRYVTGIVVMGLVMLLAGWIGWRSGGRNPFYLIAVLGYFLHGFLHFGQALALRTYTPGVITGALVVVPFGWWVWRWLRREVRLPLATQARYAVAGVVLVAPLILTILALVSVGSS